MIESVVGPWLSVADTRHDVAESTLFPEEARVVARAVDRRRAEFATVRHCARIALRGLGIAPRAILPSTRGAPAWPDQVVGSMTHCEGYRAAVVAHRGDIAGVGIDAEPLAPLSDGVLRLIARPEELQELARCARVQPGVPWERVLFSAKEAVYKAWFPLTRRWLDFDQASVVFDLDRGTFAAALLVPGPRVGGTHRRLFTGRYALGSGLVLTGVVLRRHDRVG